MAVIPRVILSWPFGVMCGCRVSNTDPRPESRRTGQSRRRPRNYSSQVHRFLSPISSIPLKNPTPSKIVYILVYEFKDTVKDKPENLSRKFV